MIIHVHDKGMADFLGDENLNHIGPIHRNKTEVVEALKEQALAARPETNVTTLDVTNTTTESIPTGRSLIRDVFFIPNRTKMSTYI